MRAHGQYQAFSAWHSVAIGTKVGGLDSFDTVLNSTAVAGQHLQT
jgi:hypothetical protein